MIVDSAILVRRSSHRSRVVAQMFVRNHTLPSRSVLLEQTRGHVDRLERIFTAIGEKSGGVTREGMEGLLKEGGACRLS